MIQKLHLLFLLTGIVKCVRNLAKTKNNFLFSCTYYRNLNSLPRITFFIISYLLLQ